MVFRSRPCFHLRAVRSRGACSAKRLHALLGTSAHELAPRDEAVRICSERMIGALDLLDGLLTLNPKHRLSASAALHQLYFKAEPRAAKPEECDTRRKHSHSPPVLG